MVWLQKLSLLKIAHYSQMKMDSSTEGHDLDANRVKNSGTGSENRTITNKLFDSRCKLGGCVCFLTITYLILLFVGLTFIETVDEGDHTQGNGNATGAAGGVWSKGLFYYNNSSNTNKKKKKN